MWILFLRKFQNFFLAVKCVVKFEKFQIYKTNRFWVQFCRHWKVDFFFLFLSFFLKHWNEITRSDFKSKSLWLKASFKISHDNEFIVNAGKGYFRTPKKFLSTLKWKHVNRKQTQTQTHWDISVYMYECTRHNVLNLIRRTLKLTIQSHKRLSDIVNKKESNSNIQPLLTFGCSFFSIECNMPLFKLVGFIYEIHLLMDLHFVHCYYTKDGKRQELCNWSMYHTCIRFWKLKLFWPPREQAISGNSFFVFLIVRFQFIHHWS